ncbi:hypothetical protein EV175_005724 [Coemansia sp. RSA 1933]|nr:hypothetical protein EV175_005724 [Coemansia sp. RSA 1933]
MRGLRSRNGLGTPLIRRALSMRKKGSKEQKQQQQQQQGLRPDAINQFSFAAHNASAPPVPKLSKLQKGLTQNKQDSPLSGGYDMVSMDDGNSPLQPSHAIKRSKSALALKQPHHHKPEDDEADSRFNAAAAASAESNMGADTPSLFSLQSSMAQLDLSSEMQTALAEEISLYGLDGLSIKESVADGGKKNEWISNIQFLRQRLADHNISVGDVTANGTKRNSTRKRRSSSSDMHLATNATLHGDTLSYKSSAIVKAAAAAAAAASVRSKEDALRDYLDNSGPVPPKAQVQLQTNNAKHGSSADDDMIAGLDAFAPVTFDAGKLFRQSLLAGSEKSPSSPFTPESARSPPEYMSTFSDVRRKYSTPKTLETAAAKSGSDQAAGGHWFLSKVKSALTGGGSGGGGGNSGGRHGSGSNVRKRQAATGGSSDGSDTAKSTGDGPLPRLDVDLGTTSLLTPDSMHRVPQHEDYTLVSQMSPFPKLQADGADPAASSATTAPASSDSAYYLIDYINGQHEDDSDRQPHKQQQKHSDIRAARRVVNKSTQMRQTQYEYNFGSQIFECLDKDLLLLKTDAFKDVEKERGRKKPTDVTGATAYTAAAINSIVAHNAKARSTKMSTSAVPSIADINASSLSWQLTTL